MLVRKPMITFVCPKCLTNLKATEDEAGSRIECRHCGRTVRVPGGSASDPPSGEVSAGGGRQWLPPLPVLIGAVAVLVVFGVATCGGVAFLFLDFSAKRAKSLPTAPAGPAAPQVSAALGLEPPMVLTYKDNPFVHEWDGRGKRDPNWDSPNGGDGALYQAYQHNQAAADLKYNGKLVQFSHCCAPLFDYRPESEGAGRYSLKFNQGTGWVRVVFRPSESGKLAALGPHPGAWAVLTVRGRCLGLSGNTVNVEDGELVSVTREAPPSWKYRCRDCGHEWVSPDRTRQDRCPNCKRFDTVDGPTKVE